MRSRDLRAISIVFAALFAGAFATSACKKSTTGDESEKKQAAQDKAASDDDDDTAKKKHKKHAADDDDDSAAAEKKHKKHAAADDDDDDTAAAKKKGDDDDDDGTHDDTSSKATDDEDADAGPPAAPATGNYCEGAVPPSPGGKAAYGLVGCPCDGTKARVGCSADKKQRLTCINGLWTATETCSGASGCWLTPGYWHCDHKVGDRCVRRARTWCGDDGYTIETCGASGTVVTDGRCSNGRCKKTSTASATCPGSSALPPSASASARAPALAAATPVTCTPALAGKGLAPMKKITKRTLCPAGYETHDAHASDGPPGVYSDDDRFCYLRCSTPSDCCGFGAGEASCNQGVCAVH